MLINVLICLIATDPTVNTANINASPIDGDWILESWIDDGVNLDVSDLIRQGIPNRLVVIKGKASLYVNDTLHTDGISYTFGSNDLHRTFRIGYNGDDAALSDYFKSRNFHGLYKISDDKLYRCYVAGDHPLPDTFRSEFGSHRQLQVFVTRKQK